MNPRKPVTWTEAEDKAILENLPKLGPMKLTMSGLVPGRTYNEIRGRYRNLLGHRQAKRDGERRDMQPVPQFARQHGSVWGYAHAVGAAA